MRATSYNRPCTSCQTSTVKGFLGATVYTFLAMTGDITQNAGFGISQKLPMVVKIFQTPEVWEINTQPKPYLIGQ